MDLKYTMLNSEILSTTLLSSTSAKWKCQVKVSWLLHSSYLKQVILKTMWLGEHRQQYHTSLYMGRLS